MIALIAALSKNRVIGKEGRIPWKIKGEQKRFKELTTGNVVIMGRRSYEEIGRPLPGRITIVVSSTKDFTGENCYTARSLFEAIRLAGDRDIFVSGGAGLYEEALPIADRLYITEIDDFFDGDTYFPAFDEKDYKKEIVAEFGGDIPYTYVTYSRDVKTKLISFDLDDTLIRGIHSVMLPCILNDREKEHAVIQEQEENGELDYEAADRLRAELFWGLPEAEIKKRFLQIARPLEHIPETIRFLHKWNIKCLLITVGPIQVAKAVSEIYGFDGYYGSDYEVKDGIFTGKILEYIRAENKMNCLADFCEKNSIDLNSCVAVGDGATDIPLFQCCGASIALNASEQAKAAASVSLEADSLWDILKYIK